MGNVQLNKPLYKSDDKEENFTPPTPRQPKPSILARGAALFLDALLLHLFFGVLVRFVPGISLALGWFAPWFGLMLGLAYFTIGYSHITLGRTLGKLILRVQVCDISGPDLSVKRSFIRVMLMFWPVAVKLALTMVAQMSNIDDPLSQISVIEILGTMLIVGWFLGNGLFAALDPVKRTVYDRLTNSIVINAELEAEPVGEYLRDARQLNTVPPRRPSIVALGLCLTLTMSLGVALAFSGVQFLQSLTDDDKYNISRMTLPGYGRGLPDIPMEPSTTETKSIAFNFVSRTPVDRDGLGASSDSIKALSAVLDPGDTPESRERFFGYIDFLLQQEKIHYPRVRFELSYAEYADLFFATEAHPVYTISREFDRPTSGTVTDDSITTR